MKSHFMALDINYNVYFVVLFWQPLRRYTQYFLWQWDFFSKIAVLLDIYNFVSSFDSASVFGSFHILELLFIVLWMSGIVSMTPVATLEEERICCWFPFSILFSNLCGFSWIVFLSLHRWLIILTFLSVVSTFAWPSAAKWSSSLFTFYSIATIEKFG